MAEGGLVPPSRHNIRINAPFELHHSRRKRLRLVGEGALVGLVGGLAIALYRFLLSNAERTMRFALDVLSTWGLVALVWFLVLAVLCLLVGKLVLVEPFTQGSGIPQLDAEVAGRIDMPWYRVVPLKIVEGVLCCFAGLSLGREGPSVLLGGMVGKGVSRAFGEHRNRERLLVTCGAAAGMSAAFHAPLTGVLFAIEEIHKEFSAPLVISVMTSSVVADYISSHILGIKPIIHFVSFSSIPHDLYASILILGVLCGLLGALHNTGMFWMQEKAFGRLEEYPIYLRFAIPFALAGAAAFFFPDLLCGGDAVVERVMNVHGETIATLTVLLMGKYLFTAICFGSGAPGGTLLPLVAMGSVVGAIYGMGALQLFGISSTYENSFIVLGIAGLFSSVVQAPVTAVVLVFELTGNLEALLSTSVISILSYVVATFVKAEPFYEHLYGRLVGKGGTSGTTRQRASEKIIRTYVICAGSLAEDHMVCEVEWPPGTLVVTVHHGEEELVAKGSTRLEALDEIAVVFGTDREEETHRALRRLCAPMSTW